MSNSRLALIHKLANEALDITFEKRDEFISREANGDLSLERAIHSMVYAAEISSDDAFLESPFSLPRFEIPEKLNQYRILEELGSGGMGVVYLGKDETVGNLVAIKVLRSAWSNAARLKSELQMLSRLKHPYICTYFSAGVFNGQPFMVMEYIEGTSLSQLPNLTLHQRLRLFLYLCNAIEHAHSKGIIHRDLKPANILIAKDTGKPKVIDFGIAKDLEEESTKLTLTGQIMGTPVYMAPELARANPDIDVRVDVYGLGGVLYFLLTGRSPYDGSVGVAQVLANLLNDPEPPQAFAPIPKDLNEITLKALRRDPDERYQTVQELKYDIQRYLSRMPVLARQGSLYYHFRLYYKRNKPWVLSVSSVFLFLIGAVFFSLNRAQVAVDALRKAEDEKAKAQAVSTFLQDTISAATPHGVGTDAPISSVLEQMGIEADIKFSNRPKELAEIHLTLSESYLTIGDFYKSHFHFSKVLESENLNQNNNTVVRATYIQGRLWLDVGEPELAWREFNSVFGKSRDEMDLKLLESMAHSARELGMYDSAISFYKESLKSSPDRLETLRGLATSQRRIGSINDSIATFDCLLYQEFLQLSPGHPKIATTLNSLGTLYYRINNYQKSASKYREAIQIREKAYGLKHYKTAHLKVNLSHALAKLELWGEAELAVLDSITVFNTIFGKTNRRALAANQAYVSLLFEQGCYKLSNKVLKDIIKSLNPSQTPAQIEMNYILSLIQIKQWNNALAMIEKVSSDLHMNKSFPKRTLKVWKAVCLFELGRGEKAYPILEEVLFSNHQDALTSIAYLYLSQRDKDPLLAQFGLDGFDLLNPFFQDRAIGFFENPHP